MVPPPVNLSSVILVVFSDSNVPHATVVKVSSGIVGSFRIIEEPVAAVYSVDCHVVPFSITSINPGVYATK